MAVERVLNLIDEKQPERWTKPFNIYNGPAEKYATQIAELSREMMDCGDPFSRLVELKRKHRIEYEELFRQFTLEKVARLSSKQKSVIQKQISLCTRCYAFDA